MMVLMLEADMSTEKAGYRVGFQKRLHDIAERYGYDSIAYETARDVVAYCHGIGIILRFTFV